MLYKIDLIIESASSDSIFGRIKFDDNISDKVFRGIEYLETNIFCTLTVIKNKEHKFSLKSKVLSLMYVF